MLRTIGSAIWIRPIRCGLETNRHRKFIPTGLAGGRHSEWIGPGSAGQRSQWKALVTGRATGNWFAWSSQNGVARNRGVKNSSCMTWPAIRLKKPTWGAANPEILQRLQNELRAIRKMSWPWNSAKPGTSQTLSPLRNSALKLNQNVPDPSLPNLAGVKRGTH